MRLLLACGILLFAAQTVEAKAPRIVGVIDCDMRGCMARPASVNEVRSYRKHHRQAKHDRGKPHKVAATIRGDARQEIVVAKRDVRFREPELVAHPEGCPRTAFCGCGVAVKVFGKPIRDLWLAANWFRYKIAEAAPGMVAVRRHHVFYIVEVIGHGRVLAYDPNSGGHKTRIHLRSLAGYRVVDPRSG